MAERLFVDTGFLLAVFNERDQYHEAAMRLSSRFQSCRELWLTEAVLLEVGAAFHAPARRHIAQRIWRELYGDPRCHVASISGSLLERGMELFGERPDKAWTLADCISFVVMGDHDLSDALSCDGHFVQAGFHALLLEQSE
jgi:predicted nucleic acid-binding protein